MTRQATVQDMHDKAAAQDPTPLPRLAPSVLKTLRQGRFALKSGDRAGALAAFTAAFESDPRAACHGWGLLVPLKAEGRDKLQPRMRARLAQWHRGSGGEKHPVMAPLTHKIKMRDWAGKHGFALPALLACASGIAALDPGVIRRDQIVIKPQAAASSRGVAVLVDGRDHMAQITLPADITGYLQDRYADAGLTQSPVMVEEALVDVSAMHDPTLVIPRDFKVFAIKGHAVMIRVHDRNAPDLHRGLITLDRIGNPLPVSQTGWPLLPLNTVPPGYDQLIAEAERASALLPWLLRFDFYLTPAGPVIGEITTFPNAGRNYTAFGKRTLLQMWEIIPD